MSWSPEEDPIPPEPGALLTTVADREQIQGYQATGKVVHPSVIMRDQRSQLLEALDNAISPEDLASRYKELINAEDKVYDEDGNIIARKPNLKVQLKAMDLLAQVRGDKAPVKSEKKVASGTIEDWANSKADRREYARRATRQRDADSDATGEGGARLGPAAPGDAIPTTGRVLADPRRTSGESGVGEPAAAELAADTPAADTGDDLFTD